MLGARELGELDGLRRQIAEFGAVLVQTLGEDLDLGFQPRQRDAVVHDLAIEPGDVFETASVLAHVHPAERHHLPHVLFGEVIDLRAQLLDLGIDEPELFVRWAVPQFRVFDKDPVAFHLELGQTALRQFELFLGSGGHPFSHARLDAGQLFFERGQRGLLHLKLDAGFVPHGFKLGDLGYGPLGLLIERNGALLAHVRTHPVFEGGQVGG